MISHTEGRPPEPRIRLAALRLLDRVFPAEPTARMTGEEQTRRESGKASGSMGRYLAQLPSKDVDVLDFGCGWGGETLWLAERVRSVVGVDIEAASIEQANLALGRTALRNCRFLVSDNGRLPLEDASVDAVFSTDTLEHVMDLPLAFGEIHRVLRPGGAFITVFGPLFYSPLGYHLRWVSQVPWAHLLFGLATLRALRAQRGGGLGAERTWRETGLNGCTFDEFRAAADGAGFRVERFNPIPVRGAALLARLPLVRHLFIFGVDCRVTKTQATTMREPLRSKDR